MNKTIHRMLAAVAFLFLSTAPVPAVPLEGAKGDESFFSLAGQAGLPRYLKGNLQALADSEGIRGGQVRTLDTDFINKDFVLDLVFQFKDDERSEAYIGIGENAHDGGWVVNSILCRLDGPGRGGHAAIVFHRKFEHLKVGDFKTAGPHLFRLEKKGDTLTMAITANYQGGAAEPDFSETIADLKKTAPYLSRLNSALFFGGDATFKAVRLKINGKLVDPGPPATRGFKDVTGPEHLIKLAAVKRLPHFFASSELPIDPEGLNLSGKSVRTRAADFVNKNFTFDVVYHFRPRDGRSIMLVGIGENGREGGWLVDTVCARVHGPVHGGLVNIGSDHNPYEPLVGKLGPDHPGPSFCRLQKCGDTLLMAVCADYKGKFEPDLVKTIPNLRQVAPYLTPKNSALFLSDGGVIEQVRLVVEGEPVESYDVLLDLPPKVLEGKPLVHKLVKDAGSKQFSVDAAPSGLTLTPAGALAWTPTREQVGHHEFQVRITDAGQTAVQFVAIDVAAAAAAKPALSEPVKVSSSNPLPLAGDRHQIVLGRDGTSLLVLEGDQLRRLDADGFTVRQAFKLPGVYEWIGERKDYLVALSDETKSLDLIDRQTLKVKRSVAMDYPRRFDLALHPLRGISFVTVQKATGEGLRNFILIVDESSGDVHEPETLIGTWVKVAPDGKILYAADKEVHAKGGRKPVDRLLVYDISSSTPREVAVKQEAGGDGFGLALSADGKRLSYLSRPATRCSPAMCRPGIRAI